MKNNGYRWAIMLLIIGISIPSSAFAGDLTIAEIVRKVFGSNKVVFVNRDKGSFEINQKVYIYSGEKLIGTGRVCSIYSDEIYTCEVKGKSYDSIRQGDLVANLPPEDIKEELTKRREARQREEEDSPKKNMPQDSREIGSEGMTVRGPQRTPAENSKKWREVKEEGKELARKGDNISTLYAEEKYLEALKLAEGNGGDRLVSLRKLSLWYFNEGKCEYGAPLLDSYLEQAIPVYTEGDLREAITEINMGANQMISRDEFACAENVLIKVASSLDRRVGDKGTAWEMIRVYDRLSYLYVEWGDDTRADTYRVRSKDISDRYGVDRRRFVSE